MIEIKNSLYQDISQLFVRELSISQYLRLVKD